jgi:hypothetical protein
MNKSEKPEFEKIENWIARCLPEYIESHWVKKELLDLITAGRKAQMEDIIMLLQAILDQEV